MPRRRRPTPARGRSTPDVRYLEDLELGAKLACGSFRFTAEEIVAFATSFDPQPWHLDPEAARDTYFGALCASGVHTQATAIGLMVRAISDVAVVAGGSLDRATFHVPVWPGQSYDVSAAWTAARPSASNPSRGIASIAGEATDAEGRVVMRFGVTYVVARRPCG